MLDDEIDEAIHDLPESEQKELYQEALHYCMDFTHYLAAGYRERRQMLDATMRMMMKEKLNEQN